MIAIENVLFSYNTQPIFHIPDWKLQQGEHCLFIGKSGSGKSTLLHLIAGLLKPAGGRITVADTMLSQLKASQADSFRSRNIGLVFQKAHLISALSVTENLLFAQYAAYLPINKSRVKEVLAELNLSHRSDAKVYELSQGEAQRVLIARALLNKPKVILADEPTSSLDDENCEAVVNLLQNQAHKYEATLAISTHDLRIKDRISNHLKLGN